MSKWWQSLSDRERVILGIGGILAILLLSYTFLWSPLSTRVSALQSYTHSQQQALQWMRVAERRIEQLKSEGFSAIRTNDRSILVRTEKTLTQHKLSRYLQKVQQPKSNQLVLQLDKAPFDDLIQWLQLMTRQGGVVIQKFTADKTKPLGTVNAVIMLQQKN